MSECNKRNVDDTGSLSPSGSCKKLRYTEPDIRVKIKGEDKEEKVYEMYAQNLARLSSFVDASLSLDMRERNNMEISFHGITPDLFEKALQFVEDPLSIRLMKPSDALELVPFYDQYEFSGGLVLCDEIMSDLFGQQPPMSSRKPPQDLDLLVQASALVHQYNLNKSRPSCISYLNSRFHSDGYLPFGATMFSEAHMRLLQPLFQEGLLRLPPGFDTEDLASSMFPKYFVKCMACDFATKRTQNLMLQGTGTHDGKFRKEGDSFIAPFRQELVELRGGVVIDAYLKIHRSDLCSGDWAITCKRVEGDPTPRVMWQSPYSKNLTLPPPEPWVPVDALRVDQKVKIKYN